MRLDKFLSEATGQSRSQVKQLIKMKQVMIANQVISDPGFHVQKEDTIFLQGKPLVAASSQIYIMLHKPAGYVTATKDDSLTVLDLIEDEVLRKKLFPVGRLDKDTEGLLLLTDDGAFSHNLMSPKKHMPKVYFFEAMGLLVSDAALKVQEGLDIGDDTKTLPAKLEILYEGENKPEQFHQCPDNRNNENYYIGQLTLSEGRYHQVKRMLHELGLVITYLKRTQIGMVSLDETLKPGEYRMLYEQELDALKNNNSIEHF